MKKFVISLLIVIFVSPVYAGIIDQHLLNRWSILEYYWDYSDENVC